MSARFLCLTPWPLLATLVVFAAVVAWTRYISLGSIVGAATFPLAAWILVKAPVPIILASIIAGVFIICRHAGNIRRLNAGTEHKFSFGGPKS